jgi:tetratricopeptide (TPR) repeat protein
VTGRRILALALLALLAAAPAALADRATAEFFAGRGEKALQAKDWAGAEEHYRRSLQEDAGFHPARYGLAQALLGSGKTAPGIEELRKFSGDVRGDAGASAEWKALLARADRQLQDLDLAGAELRKVLDRYADDLAALARKWAPKDPATAARAARRILEIRPGDREATALLEKVGGSMKGPAVSLFNGRDFAEWDNPNTVVWTVEEGFIVGNARDGQYFARHTREFTGDFDVTLEARFLEERTGVPLLGVLSCFRGPYDRYYFGLLNRKVAFSDQEKDGEERTIAKRVLADVKTPVDPMGWNVYEVRFRGNEVTALVNGEVVGTDPRPARRDGGFVGVCVQDAKVAIRRLEVQPR